MWKGGVHCTLCNTRCAVRKKEWCVDSGRCGSSSLVNRCAIVECREWYVQYATLDYIIIIEVS